MFVCCDVLVSVSTCELCDCLPGFVYSVCVVCVCMCMYVCVDVWLCALSLASWISLSYHMPLILSAAQTLFSWRRSDCSAAPPHQNRVTLSPQQFYFLSLSPSLSLSLPHVLPLLFQSPLSSVKNTRLFLDSFHLTLQNVSLINPL